MTERSPESKSMAEKVSQAIPRFQTIAADSLRVLSRMEAGSISRGGDLNSGRTARSGPPMFCVDPCSVWTIAGLWGTGPAVECGSQDEPENVPGLEWRHGVEGSGSSIGGWTRHVDRDGRRPFLGKSKRPIDSVGRNLGGAVDRSPLDVRL